jgi:hypothetical protein
MQETDMDLQERNRPEAAGPNPGGAGPAGDPQRTRQAGEDFLSAADEAISRGLAVDSATFLKSTLQEGGE